MLISDYLVPKKPKKSRRVVIIGLIITGILSATLIIVTYFGFFTGNNYLILDKELGARGIHISKYKDLSNRTSQIMIEPLAEQGLDEIDNRDIDFGIRNNIYDEPLFGIYEQKRNNVVHHYAVYQFYLINESDDNTTTDYVLNVSYFLEIVKSTNDLDKALGIRVFVDEYEDIGINHNEYDSGIILGDNKFNDLPPIENFRPKEVKRITVFFWLEGDLTNDTMVDGTLRLRIRLTIGSPVEGEL